MTHMERDSTRDGVTGQGEWLQTDREQGRMGYWEGIPPVRVRGPGTGCLEKLCLPHP